MYDQLKFQQVRETMEGVLSINGMDAKLIFRFDTESEGEHTNAIFHAENGERSSATHSTNMGSKPPYDRDSERCQ